MKKLLFISTFIVAGILVSFRADVSDHTAATVDTIEGIAVFYSCKPVAATDYLGTVKVGVTMTNKASDCLRALIKRVKKEYPGAEAILVTDPDFQKADALKFK